jgi:hypothetical protein
MFSLIALYIKYRRMQARGVTARVVSTTVTSIAADDRGASQTAANAA